MATVDPAGDVRERFDAAGELVRQGRLAEAVDAFRAVVAAQPTLLPAHANLGFALAALQRHAEAEAHFRMVIDARPDEVPVLLALARSLQKQARHGEAEPFLRRVLALQPDCVPALLGLGVCLRSLSRLDQARACFERAAQADPGCVDAYYLASTLRRCTADDPLLAGCEALAAQRTGMPPRTRARLGFALGRMYEDIGRFDDAFAAYADGNGARAGQFVLDESGEDEWLRRTCAVFDEAAMARAQPRPQASFPIPVFVVGMPRSGTTLIEQILATHPEAHGAGEIPDLWDVLRERAGGADAWPGVARDFTPTAWQALGEDYLASIARRAPQTRVLVDKMTLNYRHVGAIRLMLPQARIVHVSRDPMDVCWSCYTRLFDGDNLAFSYDLGSLGRYYARYAALMRHWRAVLPEGAMLELRYEDLVADTEAQVRRLLGFVGLPWDPACLDFHRNTRVVDTASRAQVRRPVYRSSVGRWKPFAAHLQPLRARLETAP